jgi:hypothetical protein
MPAIRASIRRERPTRGLDPRRDHTFNQVTRGWRGGKAPDTTRDRRAAERDTHRPPLFGALRERTFGDDLGATGVIGIIELRSACPKAANRGSIHLDTASDQARGHMSPHQIPTVYPDVANWDAQTDIALSHRHHDQSQGAIPDLHLTADLPNVRHRARGRSVSRLLHALGLEAALDELSCSDDEEKALTVDAWAGRYPDSLTGVTPGTPPHPLLAHLPQQVAGAVRLLAVDQHRA